MYQPISGRITAQDAAHEPTADRLFRPRAACPIVTDDDVLDWYETFAARLDHELDNYLAGWDETCQRRGLPAERRVFFARV